jgi:hypothetical protein
MLSETQLAYVSKLTTNKVWEDCTASKTSAEMQTRLSSGPSTSRLHRDFQRPSSEMVAAKVRYLGQDTCQKRWTTGNSCRVERRRCSDRTQHIDQTLGVGVIADTSCHIVQAVMPSESPAKAYHQPSGTLAQKLVGRDVKRAIELFWHFQVKKKYAYVWQCVRAYPSV